VERSCGRGVRLLQREGTIAKLERSDAREITQHQCYQVSALGRLE
jgi:hypothetical protein